MSTNHTTNHIIIFDTTLRDGEQSPGASMNLQEKLRVARVLENLNVDVIEAGFPIASPGDFEAVSTIARTIRGSTIAGLARARRLDIERCAEAVREAERPRIHTFIATSRLHMERKLRMTPDQVHEQVQASVTLARSLCDDVEWSAEDATRTELDFLCRCIETAIRAGATTVNIPDTVGYTIPEEFGATIRQVFDRVPNIDQAVISVHCHDDLGLAVANSLAGVANGARQIECTVNGLGERAGNAALEEIVMALRVRSDRLPYQTRIQTEHLTPSSRLVSTITGFAVAPNKAIVGGNAFSHEAGIHQDGILKDVATYEIMTPESVGYQRESLVVMGKHSGRNALQTKLQELGYQVTGAKLDEIFHRFKQLGDRKRIIHEKDIIALVDDELRQQAETIHFVALEVTTNSKVTQQEAHLELIVDGRSHTQKATGNGAVDATFQAIRCMIPHQAILRDYQVQGVTPGTDAQAGVIVRLEVEGQQVTGHGSDTDTVVASCRAYLNALNKLVSDDKVAVIGRRDTMAEGLRKEG